MPVKGIKRVKMNMRNLVTRITGPVTEKVVTEVMIVGMGYASLITPVDTSTLINSSFRELKSAPNGVKAKVGYTARYAAAVNAMSGKLKGEPRQHFGQTRAGVGFGGGTGVGNYWDPNAEPDFLRKGFERDGMADIKATIKRGYKV